MEAQEAGNLYRQQLVACFYNLGINLPYRKLQTSIGMRYMQLMNQFLVSMMSWKLKRQLRPGI